MKKILEKIKVSKKIFLVEILVALIVISAIGVYVSPKFIKKQEVMMAAKIKADGDIFVSKALEEFASDKKKKSSEVAQKICDELNAISKNPYNKNEPAYTFRQECKACNSVQYDDDLTMIILTTYDKKGQLVARTVIKPPSFVAYNKNDD